MEHRVWPNEIGTGNNYTDLEKKIYSAFINSKAKAWFLFDIDPIGFSNEKVRIPHFILQIKMKHQN